MCLTVSQQAGSCLSRGKASETHLGGSAIPVGREACLSQYQYPARGLDSERQVMDGASRDNGLTVAQIDVYLFAFRRTLLTPPQINKKYPKLFLRSSSLVC